MNKRDRLIIGVITGMALCCLLGFTVAEGLRISPQAGLGQPGVGRIATDADGTGMVAFSNAVAVDSVRGNLIVSKGGDSTSNAFVGGTLFATATPVFNAGVGVTNLHNAIIPAHTLTNGVDRLFFRTWLTFTNGTEAGQRLGITFGGQTGVVFIGTMGLEGEASIEGTIWRKGVSSQLITATLVYYTIGGTPFTRAWQTNTTLQLGTNNQFAVFADVADTSGSAYVTNLATSIDWHPSPR